MRIVHTRRAELMKILTSRLLLAIPLLFGVQATSAQQTLGQLTSVQQTSNDEQLRRVIAYTQAYREHLPSLECDETMLSQRVKNGKVRRQVNIKATLRELRDADEPGGFRDDYTFQSKSGKPVKPDFSALPYFVYHVFANSLGIGESPRPACFDYRFATLDDGRTLRFNIDSKPGVPDPSCTKIPDDYHKMMLIDTASGAVRRVERRMSPEFADANLEIPYVAIDYAPQKLGEEIFWLPIRFEAVDLHQQGRMIATYSNFHRYTAVAKILPRTAPVK
jgi:hypothetical protein